MQHENHSFATGSNVDHACPADAKIVSLALCLVFGSISMHILYKMSCHCVQRLYCQNMHKRLCLLLWTVSVFYKEAVSITSVFDTL